MFGSINRSRRALLSLSRQQLKTSRTAGLYSLCSIPISPYKSDIVQGFRILSTTRFCSASAALASANTTALGHGQPATFSLGDHDYGFDPIFLRDACKCSRCVDPSTQQRHFKLSQIPTDIGVESATVEGNTVHIRWQNDIDVYQSGPEEHVTSFTLDQLQRIMRYQRPVRVGRQRETWSKSFMDRKVHWTSFDDYMQRPDAFHACMKHLYKYGLVFIKDVREDSKAVETIAKQFGPLRNSFYGQSWDVKSVAEAKNVAYTNQDLGFHMDLLYMADPPAYQLLHCLKNSCEGGQSLFVDTFEAIRIIAETRPEYLEILQSYPIPYHYDNGGFNYQHEHPLLELDQSALASGRVDAIRHVNWSPPFQGPLQDRGLMQTAQKTGHHENNSNYKPHLDSARAIRQYIEAADYFNALLNDPSNIFELKLNPGECVIFENRRVAHARRAFDISGGERWLAGCYVDEDAFLSTFIAGDLKAKERVKE